MQAIFPGFNRPGLIEATQVPEIFCSRTSFRGLIAPASLKQPVDEAGVCCILDFPGFNRPGLIEAFFLLCQPEYVLHFPGFNRPGLIEARLPPLELANAADLSGV